MHVFYHFIIKKSEPHIQADNIIIIIFFLFIIHEHEIELMLHLSLVTS